MSAPWDEMRSKPWGTQPGEMGALCDEMMGRCTAAWDEMPRAPLDAMMRAAMGWDDERTVGWDDECCV